MKNIFIIFVVIVLLFLGIAIWQLHDHTPTVNYTLIETNHAFEIREYPAMLVAQTEVVGDKSIAINNGFAVLSSYLSGNNKNKQNIRMTTPVLLQQNKDEWFVTFILPDTYSESTVPKANVAHIHIKQIPAKKYIVMRFTGLGTEKQLDKHIKLMKDYVAYNNIMTVGEPIIAFYNPPWTLPFLRRNEIMLEIK